MFYMQEVNSIFILQIVRAVPFEAGVPPRSPHFLHNGAALLVCNN